MKNDSYISFSDQERTKRECGKKISDFAVVREEIKGWYEKYGLEYPDSCTNNYRDSWFHFRKIWTERSSSEIIRQMATLDEHLQRAEKDAVVKFFQTIAQRVEFWYFINQIHVPSTYIEQFNRYKFIPDMDVNDHDCTWLSHIWSFFASDEIQASFIIIYAVQKYLLCENERIIEMQMILHELKNTTLIIRMGSSDIVRINQPGEYVKECRKCYDSLNEYFEREAYFYLLGMTDVIKGNLKKDSGRDMFKDILIHKQ